MLLTLVLLCLCGVSSSFGSDMVGHRLRGHRGQGLNKHRPGDCAGESCRELQQPNLIFLLTDDQDMLVGGLQGMRYTIPMMEQYGVSLPNFFANTPVCCPSRSTILSGRYAHNWHTTAAYSCMWMDVYGEEFDRSTVGVYMQKLGYTTGAFGKLLNYELVNTPFCDEKVAKRIAGWNSTFVMCDGKFYNLTWNVNGTIRSTGNKPEEYGTSVIGNNTMKFLKENLEAGKPFFAYVGPHAPHLPSTPAAWYADRFQNLTAPRTPNYDFLALGHHYMVSTQPNLTAEDRAAVDEIARNRARTILSVDDIMISVVDLLTEYNQLNNTYIIWTSDHGYHLGQFRVPKEKMLPYDTDIRVPFLIRGPGITPHMEHSFVASHVDVTPTLLELAGGTVDNNMDGRSFAGELLKKSPGSNLMPDKALVEYWSIYDILVDYNMAIFNNHRIDMYNNTYVGVRLLNSTYNYLYVEFYPTDQYEFDFDNPFEFELFDLSNDEWQMWNLYGTVEAHRDEPTKSIIKELRDYLHTQVKCKGQKECVCAQQLCR